VVEKEKGLSQPEGRWSMSNRDRWLACDHRERVVKARRDWKQLEKRFGGECGSLNNSSLAPISKQAAARVKTGEKGA
jgi:hypothetical protein